MQKRNRKPPTPPEPAPQTAAGYAMPLYVPQREMARLASCSERQLFEFRRQGMPFRTFGRAGSKVARVMYSPGEVTKWIDNNCRPHEEAE